MSNTLIATRWNEEYRNGRYVDERPIPFVEQIRWILKEYGLDDNTSGLYIGCGNGRNYLPLVESGLAIYGLDIAPEAIKYLLDRKPALRQHLICSDFLLFEHVGLFDYLIAIQVFQHGNEAQIARYFAKVASLLKPGGLFFLRVNSSSTDIYHKYNILETNEWGGFTIQYVDGPKRGLPIHFYSRQELSERATESFVWVAEPHEDVTRRAPPKTGTWAQWEAIWQKQ